MSTRYTCNKLPGVAVTIARDGIYIELEGNMLKVDPSKPSDTKLAVLTQFQ